MFVSACLALCLKRFLNVKALLASFSQEKALVGAFSVITNLRMDFFEALVNTSPGPGGVLVTSVAVLQGPRHVRVRAVGHLDTDIRS